MGKTKQQKDTSSPVEDVAELVRRLCVSTSNTMMYTVDHPVVANAIKQTSEWPEKLLKKKKLSVPMRMSSWAAGMVAAAVVVTGYRPISKL